MTDAAYPFTVAIVGTRDHYPDDEVWTAIERLKATHDRLMVVTGDATGVDQVAIDQAKICGVLWRSERAYWSELGRSAGAERNARVIVHADMLLAFFHPKPFEKLAVTSPGTVDAILQALHKGIPVHVHHRGQYLKPDALAAFGKPRPYRSRGGRT